MFKLFLFSEKDYNKGLASVIRSLVWLVKLSEMTNGVSVPFSKSENTTHLVEAASLARGGERTRGAFYATMDSFKGDIEMSAIYAKYEKEVVS